MVRWLHDERGLEWHARVCASAASLGRLEMLKYVRSRGCPWHANTTWAAQYHLEVLRWSVENGCVVKMSSAWISRVPRNSDNSYVSVLEYLHSSVQEFKI